MNKERIKTYPCEDAVRMVDALDDGLLKDKDEFVDKFYRFQTSQSPSVASDFDNFLMRYNHWVIEDTKEKILNKACGWIKDNFTSYTGVDVSSYYAYDDEFVNNFRKAMLKEE